VFRIVMDFFCLDIYIFWLWLLNLLVVVKSINMASHTRLEKTQLPLIMDEIVLVTIDGFKAWCNKWTNVNYVKGSSVTKKERPGTTTGPLLSLSDPDLLHTYRPSIFLTLGLSTDSYICTLRVINTQHTTTRQTT
jgi:hypothetical protein